MFTGVSIYELGLLIVGAAGVGAVVLPRVLAGRPLTFPLVYLGFGALLFRLPTPFEPFDAPANPAD